MANITRNYSDLNLSFIRHPVTGDVSRLTGIEAVKRAIRNLVLTSNYERPYQPGLGSGVASALFENITLATKHQLETSIEDVIRNYEPRAKILRIRVEPNPDNNQLTATITFEVLNMLEPVTIDVILERVR